MRTTTGEGCPKARPAVASGGPAAWSARGWSPGDPDLSLGRRSDPECTTSPPQAMPSRLMKLERWFWPLTSDSKMRSQTSVCGTQSAQPSPRGHRAAPRGHCFSHRISVLTLVGFPGGPGFGALHPGLATGPWVMG